MNVYFTEGSLLPYEHMMKLKPQAKRTSALSSSNLPLWPLGTKTETSAQNSSTEVTDNEHGQ